jgi:hypothetical protein
MTEPYDIIGTSKLSDTDSCNTESIKKIHISIENMNKQLSMLEKKIKYVKTNVVVFLFLGFVMFSVTCFWSFNEEKTIKVCGDLNEKNTFSKVKDLFRSYRELG